MVDDTCLTELLPTGYEIKQIPRQDTRIGGGGDIVYKDRLSLKILNSTLNKSYTHFEYMDCHLDIAGQQLRISVLYRPPPSKANGLKNRIFVDEWASYLDQVATSTTETLLVGDLNIHLDVKDDIDARRFTGMLYSYGLQQHVKDPNHKKDRYWMSSLPRKLVHLSRNLQLPILSCVTTMDILRLIIMLSISRRPSPSQSLHGTESSIENFKRSMVRSLSRTFHYSCIYMKGPSMSLSWHTTSHLPGL